MSANGVCWQGWGGEGGSEEFCRQGSHTGLAPGSSLTGTTDEHLKSYNCCEAILCKLNQRRKKESFWIKAEYNPPGSLRGLSLTGKREQAQGPAVPRAKLGRSLAHNYSNVPKAREVWRNKGHMSKSYSWPSNPFPNLIIFYLWNSPLSITFSYYIKLSVFRANDRNLPHFLFFGCDGLSFMPP